MEATLLQRMFDQDLVVLEAELTGHFPLRSGKHSKKFFQLALLARKPIRLRRYCRALALELADYGPDVVIGPAKGAIGMADEIAAALAELGVGEPDALYAEKARFDKEKGIWVADESSKTFKVLRGFGRFIEGRRVCVVEDALSTGGSCGGVAMATREVGGEVKVLGVLLQRGEIRVEGLEGVPTHACRRRIVDDSDPSACQECLAGIPLTPIPGKS